jgi:hypothetical protein
MTRTILGPPCLNYVERRRSPRIDPAGSLRAELLTAPVQVRLCNLSADGFLVAATVPFEAGTSHRFRFRLDDWASGALVAVSVRTVRDDHDTATFVTGFEFAGPRRASTEVIERMIAAAIRFA